MIIRNKDQRRAYREAGCLTTELLEYLATSLTSGQTTQELDTLAWQWCQQHQVEPVFATVPDAHGQPYGFATCISVNEVVVHGLPGRRVIEDGDLVSLDVGLRYQGLCTDACITVGVGTVTPDAMELLTVGRSAVMAGVQTVKAGARTGDVGQAIESQAQAAGFDTVKEYIGHGIGKQLHEPPELPAWGQSGTGEVLQAGQVICVEAQVVGGNPTIRTLADGWSVATRDGLPGVMFEYLSVVTEAGVEILTPTQSWPLTR